MFIFTMPYNTSKLAKNTSCMHQGLRDTYYKWMIGRIKPNNLHECHNDGFRPHGRLLMIIGIKDKTWYCGRLKSRLIIKLTTLSVTMVTHQRSITCYLLQNTTPIKHKSKFHDNHDHVWLSPPKSALLCIKLILFFICLHFFISSSNKSAVLFDTWC